MKFRMTFWIAFLTLCGFFVGCPSFQYKTDLNAPFCGALLGAWWGFMAGLFFERLDGKKSK